MRLVVTARAPLERRYGPRGARRLLEALARYVETLEAHGSASALLTVDDADSLELVGATVVEPRDPRAVRSLLRGVIETVGTVRSVLLVGGDHVLPHFRLANPVRGRHLDPDRIVLTDLPYVTWSDADPAHHAEVVPLGRLPDGAQGPVDVFADTIDGLADLHRSPVPLNGSFMLFNREWAPAARLAGAMLPEPKTVAESPGRRVTGASNGDLARSLLYFSLHGFADGVAWHGFDAWSGEYAPAVTPDAFKRAVTQGITVFCSNCYGAYTVGKSIRNSSALRAVAEGARAFVGSTGLAFGTHLDPIATAGAPPLAHAHLFAKSFIDARVGGARAGDALMRARNDYITTAREDGRYTALEQKTALEFILLGDPAL